MDGKIVITIDCNYDRITHTRMSVLLATVRNFVEDILLKTNDKYTIDIEWNPINEPQEK